MSDAYVPPSPSELADWDARRAAARVLAEARGYERAMRLQLVQPGMRLALVDELRRLSTSPGRTECPDPERFLEETIIPAILSRIDEMVEYFISLHARMMTPEQMKYAAEFYSTPLGQQILLIEPELRESMGHASSTWMVGVLRKALSERQDEPAVRGSIPSSQRTAPR